MWSDRGLQLFCALGTQMIMQCNVTEWWIYNSTFGSWCTVKCIAYCLTDPLMAARFKGLLVRNQLVWIPDTVNSAKEHDSGLHNTCSLLSSCFLAERSCSRALLSWTLTSVLFSHSCRGSALASNSVIWDCRFWKCDIYLGTLGNWPFTNHNTILHSFIYSIYKLT